MSLSTVLFILTVPFTNGFNMEKYVGKNINTDYIAAEFASFRNMFLLMGSVLSFIVGLIGVLNFLNAVLTGIITRHKEFTMLPSIDMTGKQLKKMLVLENMFWFFDYKFTAAPLFITAPIFAVLGVILPLISYRFLAKKSIVDRLREIQI